MVSTAPHALFDSRWWLFHATLLAAGTQHRAVDNGLPITSRSAVGSFFPSATHGAFVYRGGVGGTFEGCAAHSRQSQLKFKKQTRAMSKAS
jgi:hypothetical protein